MNKDPYQPLDEKEKEDMEGVDFENIFNEENIAFKQYQKMLQKKNKMVRFSITISEEDLEWYKEEAENNGMPYQTFIKMTLHRYKTGALIPQKSL